MWTRVNCTKIPIYTIIYLLERDYRLLVVSGVVELAFWCLSAAPVVAVIPPGTLGFPVIRDTI